MSRASSLLTSIVYLSATWVIGFGCDSSPEFSPGGGGLGDGDGDRSGNGDGDGDGDDGGLSLGGNRGDGDSGDGDVGGAGGRGSCAESGADADLVPANLLFVVDKSGSMNCNAPPLSADCETNPVKEDVNEPSKWEITQQALTGPEGALQVLSGQPGVSVGLITFPLDDHCQVPAAGELRVDVAELNQSHLDDLTAGLTENADGSTPLAGAAIRGLEALRQGIVAGDLLGDNYLVLMTDGAETCQPGALDDLREFVQVASDGFGIQTFVIGAPGSESARPLLSEIAVLGGTRSSDDCQLDPGNDASASCHIDLTESQDFEVDLGNEFRGITEVTTQTCEYDVPSSALVDKNRVNVEFTPSVGDTELVLQDSDADCDSAEGWQYTEDETQIVLCGQVCDDVLSDPGATVRVVFGCRETVTVVR